MLQAGYEVSAMVFGGIPHFVFITIFVVPIGGCGVCFGTFVPIFGASPDCFEFDLFIINTIL